MVSGFPDQVGYQADCLFNDLVHVNVIRSFGRGLTGKILQIGDNVTDPPRALLDMRQQHGHAILNFLVAHAAHLKIPLVACVFVQDGQDIFPHLPKGLGI